jgi:tyrosyl-tRNA synthetase
MDKNDLINEVLTRGVENIYPSKEFLREKLLNGEKLVIYLGIDPTGPTLHLGHSIALLKLSQFQQLGHSIILLIGDFTATIGDPTSKRKIGENSSDLLLN